LPLKPCQFTSELVGKRAVVGQPGGVAGVQDARPDFTELDTLLGQYILFIQEHSCPKLLS